MDKKKIKIISIIAAVLAVIIAASVVFAVNYSRIQTDVMYSMMPDYIDGSFDDVNPVRIYKRKNLDYDYKAQKNTPLAAYEFYFYDEDGNEVSVNGNDMLYVDGEEIGMLYLNFLPEAMDNLSKLQTKLIVAALIVAIIILSGLIVLWFFSWSKRQDAEKERLYGNKNQKKRKKSRK